MCTFPWLHFFLLFLFVASLHLHRTLWKTSREIIPASVFYMRHRKLKDPPYLSPLLFSVNYYDAFILSPSHLVLSAICIPVQWCPLTVQRSCKAFRLSRRRYKTPNQFLFGLPFFIKPHMSSRYLGPTMLSFKSHWWIPSVNNISNKRLFLKPNHPLI